MIYFNRKSETGSYFVENGKPETDMVNTWLNKRETGEKLMYEGKKVRVTLVQMGIEI